MTQEIVKYGIQIKLLQQESFRQVCLETLHSEYSPITWDLGSSSLRRKLWVLITKVCTVHPCVKRRALHYFFALAFLLSFYASLGDQNVVVLMDGAFVLYNVPFNIWMLLTPLYKCFDREEEVYHMYSWFYIFLASNCDVAVSCTHQRGAGI